MEERFECTECRKVFTKRKQFNLHMKSMQHTYRVEFLNDRKQEKEVYFKVEAEERDRRAALTRRAMPIVERFHAKMYLLIQETEEKEKEKEKEGKEKKEKEKPGEQKNAGDKAKEKGDTKNDPWAVLSQSINEHYRTSRPREIVRKKRRCLFTLVKEVTYEFFPEAKLEVYGSIPLHLDAENSDIDVSIMLKEGSGWGGASGHDHALNVLNTIGDAIDFCGSTHIRVTKVASILFTLFD